MDINSRTTSIRHNMRQTRAFVLSFMVAVIVSVATCSCSSNASGPEITDAPSALKAHKAFLRKASFTKEADIKSLIEMAKEWYVLSDTLEHHIQPDSAMQKVYDRKMYSSLQDSIAGRLENMVDMEVRSFDDVLTVREALGKEPEDSVFKKVSLEAQKFFDSLDLAQVPNLTKDEAMDSYTVLLKSYLKKGIKSKSDMQRFIRAEDIAFRGFLVHLHELGNTSLKNITNSTEAVCGLVFKSAHDGQMTAEIPLTYMLMRTNRRIIQNAMTCLADIKAGRVTGSSEQAVVYLWMMMKPFFPTDDISISLLYDKQKADLSTLAHELPAVSAKLNKGMRWSPLPIEEMPNEIIKEIVSRR